jgi:hypothetical protein
MGIILDAGKLMSKEELLRLLRENGADYTSLTKVRDRYEEVFGPDLIWNYPLTDGYHTGFMMVPVKEGFMALPYNAVDEDVYEIFELDHAQILDEESLDLLLMDFKSYATGLCRAMQEAQKIVKQRKRTS